jgi:hypothetical protein
MIHPTTLTLSRAYMKKTIQEKRQDLKGRRVPRYSPQPLSMHMQEHGRTYWRWGDKGKTLELFDRGMF